MPSSHAITNFLSIDVEDYYQVSAFENMVGHDKWDNYPSRVANNTLHVLSILDQHNVKATFFILGWVAQKFPGLITKIQGNGHEIACHSLYHRLVYSMSPEEFRQDTQTAKDILEQAAGTAVMGYRAPSYSITKDSLWAYDILTELGFTYDSSVFPIHHDRYGIPDAPRFIYQVPGQALTEFPLSTAVYCGIKVPVAGGGYFRIFPYWLIKAGLKKINMVERQPFTFYFHPWEIDPGQPTMEGARLLTRARHCINLRRTESRLHRLLSDFQFQPLNKGILESQKELRE